MPSATGNDVDSLEGIVTPNDEFLYWKESANNRGTNINEIDRAKFFHDYFQTLQKDFADLTSSKLDVIELLERTEEVLDDVWKQVEHEAFPLNRMKHLFQIIGTSLAANIPKKLASLDVWKGSFTEVRSELRTASGICNKWMSICHELTAQFWKGYDRNPWNEEPHVDERVSNLGSRIEEVLSLRTQHEQLVRLLAVEEQQSFSTASAFDAFDGLKPLHYNPYTDSIWRSAVTEYERKMAQAETVVAGKLRLQFKELEGSSHQLIREFQRYKLLIARPNISRELVTERETLLAQLAAQMSNLKSDYSSRSTKGAGKGGVPTGRICQKRSAPSSGRSSC